MAWERELLLRDGLPVRVVAQLGLKGKVWRAQLVTRTFWLELATWKTKRSALQGWRFEPRVGGFRIVTPLFGAGLTLSVGSSPGGSRTPRTS